MATPILNNCVICGNEFIQKSKWIAKTCSPSCHSRLSAISVSLKKTGIIPKAQQWFTCENCGKEYQKKPWRTGNEGERFCSRECCFIFLRNNPSQRKSRVKEWLNPGSKQCLVYFHDCRVCGETYTSRSNKPSVCSYKCKLKEIALKSKFSTRYGKISICKECGNEYTVEYQDTRRCFCSDVCLKKHSKRIGKAVRRARKKGNGAVSFDPALVFERDQWKCQLCGVKTLKSKRGTIHDRAPELDHIIPLSKGGPHTPSNTQCSCRRCNYTKGSDINGQLRIF